MMTSGRVYRNGHDGGRRRGIVRAGMRSQNAAIFGR
jgi:hypothetical protein